MSATKYSIGLDYGTNSVRTLIVNVANGREVASAVWNYTHGMQGVILSRDPNLARQHPADYVKGAELTIKKALALAKQSGAKTVKRSDVAKLSFDLIFNATPVGMGSDPQTPLEENELNALWVFDSVYNPIETRLLKLAQTRGCGTISGAEMFLHQAARQFEIWTGKPAPLDAIRQVLLRQLGAAGGENAEAIPTVVSPKAIKTVAANPIVAVASEVAKAGDRAPEAARPEAAGVAKAAAKKAPAQRAGEKTSLARAAPAKAGIAAPEKTVAKAAPVKAAAVKAAVKAGKAAPKAPAKAVAKAAPKKTAATPAAKKSGKAKGR